MASSVDAAMGGSGAVSEGRGPSGPPQRPLLTELNERGFRLVMVADALALLFIAVGSMVIRFGFDWPDYSVPLYLLSFSTTTALFVLFFYFGGLYEREPRLGASPTLPRAAALTLGAGGLTALLTLALSGLSRVFGGAAERLLPFPIANLAVLIAIGAVAVALNRSLVHRLRTRREGPPKVLVVGAAGELEVAARHLDDGRVSAIVVGKQTTGDGLLDAVLAGGATDVLLLSRSFLDPLYPTALEQMERQGVTVLLRITARETMFGLQGIREVGGMPFVLLRSQTIPRSRARFKRMTDLVLLFLATPLWLPVLAAIGTYQLAVARRPLLYWQARIGLGGRPFQMVKFRTMRIDAESDGLGARLAEREDPRVIPACRWVRAMRMDELPQLWNVLRGEMSLVGPRPERPEMTERFEGEIDGYRRRHELPPGLTGLAQIHGRYHTDPEYKLGYDLQYLVNWSPVLDLQILVRTLFVVLLRRL